MRRCWHLQTPNQCPQRRIKLYIQRPNAERTAVPAAGLCCCSSTTCIDQESHPCQVMVTSCAGLLPMPPAQSAAGPPYLSQPAHMATSTQPPGTVTQAKHRCHSTTAGRDGLSVRRRLVLPCTTSHRAAGQAGWKRYQQHCEGVLAQAGPRAL